VFEKQSRLRVETGDIVAAHPEIGLADYQSLQQLIDRGEV